MQKIKLLRARAGGFLRHRAAFAVDAACWGLQASSLERHQSRLASQSCSWRRYCHHSCHLKRRHCRRRVHRYRLHCRHHCRHHCLRPFHQRCRLPPNRPSHLYRHRQGYLHPSYHPRCRRLCRRRRRHSTPHRCRRPPRRLRRLTPRRHRHHRSRLQHAFSSSIGASERHRGKSSGVWTAL